MLGHSPGSAYAQGFVPTPPPPPPAYNEQTWSLAKFTSLSGPQKVNIEGGVRAVFSQHRRQLAVWHESAMMLCLDLHHAKTSIPMKEVYAIVKENNASLCRLKFRSLPDRVSFGAALGELVHVSNDKGASSQEPSSQSWQGSSQGASTSSQSEYSSASSQGRPLPTGGNPIAYNWSGHLAPPSHFTPPFTPHSQPIIGTTSHSQHWKMTPPSSQSSSQQYKALMHPHDISSPSQSELTMERSEWSTPLKRPAEAAKKDTVAKRRKEEPVVHANTWDTSSLYSDSDSFNDSFSSCSSSQKSDFSSQSMTQPLEPVVAARVDGWTECSVERSEVGTQTDASLLYPPEEEIAALLERLMQHPEFITFTNQLSARIDADEELLALVDKNFIQEEEEDADKTQPLDEEEENEKTKGDESGNESDQSDIIDL